MEGKIVGGIFAFPNFRSTLFVISINNESNRLNIYKFIFIYKNLCSYTLNQIEHLNIVLMIHKYIVQIFHNLEY